MKTRNAVSAAGAIVLAAALAAGAPLGPGAVAASSATGPVAGADAPLRSKPSLDRPAQAALAALRAHGSALGFSTGGGASALGRLHTVEITDVIADRFGTHVRMERRYAGLQVIGGDFVVHLTPDGAWNGVSATLRGPVQVSLIPGLNAASAVPLALLASVPGAIATSAPRLVVDASSGTARLAWLVRTAGQHKDGMPSLRDIYVDARNGRLGLVDEQIHAADGLGESHYSGVVALNTLLDGSLYELQDLGRGGSTTVDAEGRTDDCLPVPLPLCTSNAPGTRVTDDDNRWGNGGLLDPQTVAVDAQYGAMSTWDYFLDRHGRRGNAGDGVGTLSRVHYGSGFANAFYNEECRCVTYGDGDGKSFGPLVSLDIAAHEITHGLSSATAKLFNSGEAGGLGEASSDIFAAMVEFHAGNKADPGDYTVGEKIFLRGAERKAVRYMDQPSRDGASPDCFAPGIADFGVHGAAGPANHFFFLLAEGSGSQAINGVQYDSPTCDGSTVAGIGRTKAAKIWYRALTAYFTSAMGYTDARRAVLQAAQELYGVDSKEAAAVKAGWDAVGVSAGASRTQQGGGLL
ncbi:MAG: M4 family metallopeptidase [Sporichthyaceae bacterium]